jgi:hypothetical protein
MQFWTEEKIEKVKSVVKKCRSLGEAAQILSEHFDTRISLATIRHTLWRYSKLRASDMLLPSKDNPANRIWRKEDAAKVKVFLNESSTFEEAKDKIAVHFGRPVTYNSVKGILVKHGISASVGECLNKAECRATRKRSDWTKVICDQAVAVLGKHHTLNNAITELLHQHSF